MNDREVFRRNLNYYLSISGKLQKDLADYVGAKTTTVSGWTRGVSYPRADAMERIAMFFGIPTSELVGSEDDALLPETIQPKIRIVSGMMERMSEEQQDQVVNVLKAMFSNHPELLD